MPAPRSSNNYAGSWSNVGDLFAGVQTELAFIVIDFFFHNERTRGRIKTFFLHLSLPPGSGAKQSKGETD